MNCHRLKNIIQDLIDKGKLVVDGHTSNEENVMFREPFPKHDKGKASKIENNVNYTTASYDYIVNHISMDNHVSTIIIKGKTPKVLPEGVKLF